MENRKVQQSELSRYKWLIRPLFHRNAIASLDWIGKSAPVPLLFFNFLLGTEVDTHTQFIHFSETPKTQQPSKNHQKNKKTTKTINKLSTNHKKRKKTHQKTIKHRKNLGFSFAFPVLAAKRWVRSMPRRPPYREALCRWGRRRGFSFWVNFFFFFVFLSFVFVCLTFCFCIVCWIFEFCLGIFGDFLW